MRDAPQSRRRALLGAAAAALASGVARAGDAAAGRTPLVVVGPWEIGGLAPARSGFVFARMQVAETLVDIGDDGVPVPGLAASWTTSGDGLQWRFALRAGARFHDGSPVTAGAVARSLREATTPPAALGLAPIRSIDADRDGVVAIRLKTPFAGLAALLSHYSAIVLAPASYGRDGAVQSIVATGPYRVTALAPPQQLDAERFDGWNGGGPLPEVERVRYLVASRAETRSMMAESGQADLAFSLDPASVTRLSSRNSAAIASVLLPRTLIVKLNAGLPALGDVRVRRALALAIDREGIARALMRDATLAATQLFPPSMTGWHDPARAPLGHDPASAARLLDEAGWRLTAGTRRNAGGTPLTLMLRTFPDRPELPTIAAALQAQWRRVGVEVSVSIGNSGDIPLAHRDGTLQLALAARNYGAVADPVGTLLQDFGAGGGDWGATGWRDETVVDALDALATGRASGGEAARARSRVASALHEGLPVIPVSWYRQQVAVSRRIVQVDLDPFERSYRLTRIRWRR
ncbi:MAG: ABC transporter substrate-binding protein [Burkholderiales bacterium]|nr:MAG: ABC transporter substrate-binding protein [Burkholderiales bacterium]